MIQVDQNIYKKIQSRFTNVKSIENGLLRCERSHKDKPVDVHYFDFSESLFNSEFNLNEYTEKVVSGDYYNNPGDLQWNYYLTFISSPQSILKESFLKIKWDTETNKSFVRKSVMTTTELTEWLDYFSKDQQVKDPQSDLSTTWMKGLREQKLDGVFLGSSFKEVVDAYCSGNPILETDDAPDEDLQENNPDLTELKELILTKYRKYPAAKNYAIGKVTLVTGPNGAGKTSFLEAIELNICGKSFRSDEIESNADIKLRWSPNLIEYYDPGKTKKYRQRDAEWYGNVYPKGNDLVERFNRFNFHDTDAAFRLSNEEQAGEIKNVLIKLTLGEAVNDLAKKIEGTRNAFDLKRKGHASVVTRDKKEVEQLTELVTKLQQNINEPGELLKSIQKNLKSLSWLGYIPQNPTDSAIETLEQSRRRNVESLR